MKNVLMILPEYPRSVLTFEMNVRAMGGKALMPPLGLMTVAAMLPEGWRPRLVDTNVRPVEEADWAWADLVMLSGMLVQRDGVLALIAEAGRRGKPVIAGGPYATAMPEELLEAGCRFVVSGEGEEIMGELKRAVEKNAPPTVLRAEGKPDLNLVPIPRYDLVDCRDYDFMAVQTSRGCPFACEFCDIINLFGQTPRHKPVEKVLAELQTIYETGYTGKIFISDDNFIGNPKRAEELLRAIKTWNRRRGEPFWFITQASVNLGTRPELIDLMAQTNFAMVLLGIESPDEDVLAAASKTQNVHHPLLDSVRAINAGGLSIIGSFILGFDQEKPGADKRILAFMEAAGLPLVILNVMQAVPGTRLWERLKTEGRLRKGHAGDMSTGMVMNFEPTRPVKQILSEHMTLWENSFDFGNYMDRALDSILAMRPSRSVPPEEMAGPDPDAAGPVSRANPLPEYGALSQFMILARLAWSHGVLSRHRMKFWRNLRAVWRENPSRLRRYLLLLLMGWDMQDLSGVVRRRAAPALA